MSDTNSATRTTIEPSALSSGNLATNSSGQTLVYINSSTQISQKLSKNGNYAAWHSQFTNLLFGYDLIGYIDGTIPCPSKTKTSSCSLDPVDNPDHRFWLRKDRLILHAIQTEEKQTIVEWVFLYYSEIHKITIYIPRKDVLTGIYLPKIYPN